LLSLAVLLFSGSTAHAQRGTISVTVVDQTGLPIPNAKITATNGTIVLTDANGAALVPQGTIRATAPGLDSGPAVATNTPLRLTLRPTGVAEAVTVTATRSSGIVGEHAETIDVLTGPSLRQFPALTLDETLRQHPGFELYRRAGSRVANPTSEGISLRGLGSTAVSRTLVLEDGAPVNDPFGGWIHWNETPPESISAVTVATGGGSDLYGSSALGGVIDIVPAHPTASLGDFAASGAGQTTSDVSGRLDRGGSQWLGTVAGEGFRTAGYTPTDPAVAGPVDVPANSHFQNGHAELDRRIGPDGRAFLLGNGLNEARGNGTVLTNNATRLWRYLGGDDWTLNDRVSGRLRAFGTDQGYRQSFSSIPASRLTETLTRLQRVHVQEIGLSADAASHFGPFALVGGADVRDIRANDVETPIAGGVVTSVQDTTARQRFVGGFGEALYARGGWSVAASVRVDHASNLDTVQKVNAAGTPLADRSEVVASPRVGVVRRVNRMLSLKAAGFRAFRAATMNELYRTGQVGQQVTQPNAGLLSERATGWEAGTNLGSEGDRLSGGATFFWTEINRPVSAVPVSTNLYKRQNLGQLRSQGVELRGVVRMMRGVTGTVGYQFADAVVTKFSAQPALVGNKLPEVPQNAVTAQLRVETGRVGSFTFAVRRSGTVFDDSANTLVLRGFFQADLYGERRVAHGVVLFGSAQNLFNQRADVSRTPQLTLGSGIVAVGGLKLSWGSR
jgi:outer membrane receptor protein involved in Fe transport